MVNYKQRKKDQQKATMEKKLEDSLLKRYGFRTLNDTDSKGNSLYQAIVQSDSTPEQMAADIRALVYFNVDPNKANHNGDTFIHSALMRMGRKADITYANIESFLTAVRGDAKRKGFDVNTQNNQRRTIWEIGALCLHNDKDIKDYMSILNQMGYDFIAKDGSDYIAGDRSNCALSCLIPLPKDERLDIDGIMEKLNSIIKAQKAAKQRSGSTEKTEKRSGVIRRGSRVVPGYRK